MFMRLHVFHSSVVNPTRRIELNNKCALALCGLKMLCMHPNLGLTQFILSKYAL